jgi:hypothetical protein
MRQKLDFIDFIKKTGSSYKKLVHDKGYNFPQDLELLFQTFFFFDMVNVSRNAMSWFYPVHSYTCNVLALQHICEERAVEWMCSFSYSSP